MFSGGIVYKFESLQPLVKLQLFLFIN